MKNIVSWVRRLIFITIKNTRSWYDWMGSTRTGRFSRVREVREEGSQHLYNFWASKSASVSWFMEGNVSPSSSSPLPALQFHLPPSFLLRLLRQWPPGRPFYLSAFYLPANPHGYQDCATFVPLQTSSSKFNMASGTTSFVQYGLSDARLILRENCQWVGEENI